MKTKEGILKETILKDGYDQGGYERHFKFGKHTTIKAMQEYADQQTEQLKKELEGIKEVYKDLQSINDFGTKCLKEKELFIENLQSKLSEKDKELSELKAKQDKTSEMFRNFIRQEHLSLKWETYLELNNYFTQTHGQ